MNNEEKNSYVQEQITRAAIQLLAQNELSALTISQIAAKAQVSRNSFYRNYVDKEDIFCRHIKQLLSVWAAAQQGEKSNAQLYGSLFAHMMEQRDFYLLLKKRGLFHLFLKVFTDLFGPKAEYDNMAAYVTAFLAYGTFGWIEEWLARGMQESADSMAQLLASHGMQ